MSPTPSSAPRRYVLVGDAEDAHREAGPVRRLRLARLDLSTPPRPGEDRFAYLKRTYD